MAICSFCLNAFSSTSKASCPNSLEQKRINGDQSKLRITGWIESSISQSSAKIHSKYAFSHLPIALSIYSEKNSLVSKCDYLVLITRFNVILISIFLFICFVLNLIQSSKWTLWSSMYYVLSSMHQWLIITVGKHCRHLQKPLLLYWLLYTSAGETLLGRYTFL